jgi:hypothetical protein
MKHGHERCAANYGRKHTAKTNLASGAIAEACKNALEAQCWRRPRHQLER